MLKISERAESSTNRVTLVLEGRLSGEWVDEFKILCGSAFARHRQVNLLLDDVDFADHRGVETLVEAVRKGAAVVDASPFLREQLKVALEKSP